MGSRQIILLPLFCVYMPLFSPSYLLSLLSAPDWDFPYKTSWWIPFPRPGTSWRKISWHSSEAFSFSIWYHSRNSRIPSFLICVTNKKFYWCINENCHMSWRLLSFQLKLILLHTFNPFPGCNNFLSILPIKKKETQDMIIYIYIYVLALCSMYLYIYM